MAHPAIVSNSRGSALVEGLPISLLLAAFITMALATAYFLFAQAWVSSEAEQSLYCLAENRPESECQRQLRARIQKSLPFGQLKRVNFKPGKEEWNVKLEWQWNSLKIRIDKRLSIRGIKAKRDLRW